MKKNKILIIWAVLVLVSMTGNVRAAGRSVLSGGARLHMDNSVSDDIPFGDDDISVLLGYEYHEDAAFWQLAVGYTPDVDSALGVDYVVTPQMNLIIKDNMWRAGFGALWSYVKPDVGKSDWTDVYWQFLLGINLPVMGLSMDVNAYYPFEDWGDLGDFDFSDVEYGVLFGYQF